MMAPAISNAADLLIGDLRRWLTGPSQRRLLMLTGTCQASEPPVSSSRHAGQQIPGTDLASD